MPTTVLWFRRDLRLRDHPALLAAAGTGSVVPVFVLDPAFDGAGAARREALHAALRSLHEATDGALVVRRGRPEEVIPALVRETGAAAVHVTRETTPYGRRRDAEIERALDVDLVATGTPYAVGPGVLRKADGTPYRVFTPFSRAWRDHGAPGPAPLPAVRWAAAPADAAGARLLAGPDTDGAGAAGEDAALRRWEAFLDDGLERYAERRDRPDLAGTSRLSADLKLGTVHPRTLLADVAAHPAGGGRGAQTFVSELCWREFYADVLHHHPASAWADLREDLGALVYDDPATEPTATRFEAWRAGRTGYPFVDAGMRQLLAEGWMHNRVRMVTASFLVKDLHVWWPHGARHFLDLLRDGDIASNSHGWQWTAGTGTDAAPYFRVFNPVTQGLRFDPGGDYVRRYVPELAHLAGAAAHEPWRHGGAPGYPERVVDHAAERAEALARYEAARR